jgi:hypothetical protein
MRTRIFYAAIPLAVSAAVFAACSGSDPQEAFPPDSGSDVTTTPPDVSVPDTNSGFDAGGDSTVRDAPSDAPFNIGEASIIDGGSLYEGGLPCVTDGVVETEPANDSPPNGDAGTPDILNPAVCGAILLGTGADGGIDVDYLRFRLKNTTTTFFVGFSGNIKMTISVEGPDGGIQTVVITPTSGGAIPFVQNKDYTVKVESNDGARQNWIIRLNEQ